MNEQQLLDLKEEVNEAKIKVSELTGQLTALTNQLKIDWDCKTISDAEIKLKSMEDTVKMLDRKIEKGIKELEEKYEI